MPEYLAPGVFVEEVSFRSRSIEGVATSTTGFAGLTRWGPVCYPNGPSSCEPRLVTSFTEFERIYGGLQGLRLNALDPSEERLPYTAHAARAFFDNGGKRLYIARVFLNRLADGEELGDLAADQQLDRLGIARRSVNVAGSTALWLGRWPGNYGNVRVEVQAIRSKNILFVPSGGGAPRVRRAKAGAVLEVFPAGADLPSDIPPPHADAMPLDLDRMRVLRVDPDGSQSFVRADGTSPDLNPTDRVVLVEMRVSVQVNDERLDVYDELGAAPEQMRYIGHILQRDDPEDEDAVVWLQWQPGGAAFQPAQLLAALVTNPTTRLAGGHDGLLAPPSELRGRAADPDRADRKATGLEALGEIEDLAIVALPDGGTYGSGDVRNQQAAAELIGHAERLRYRIAVVDGPRGSSLNEIRAFRGQFDSKYAALYHPWIEILDPTARPAQGAPPRRLLLPPSGFVAGIYARNDVTRGVSKAPANEVVRGLTRFEANINQPRQEVLNPEGINALRFFEGRGHRVWGARTISSDPEWKYVNVRRLFIFMEHSIDRGTQWAVFEPNNERLWANVRRTVEDFLLGLWKDGALLGDKPEKAYFVRCDRTTMTQNDLDNGRLICLIGVAPVKPAEFVIFRIGQWTADARD
ncbi:MAG: phage tail sheath subtilisin-like domain-containing protein [Pirellulaceae bacterium]|nr:phage tail sheath subtilisin-like domain-containing protein [Pirellulaceae bacterium]